MHRVIEVEGTWVESDNHVPYIYVNLLDKYDRPLVCMDEDIIELHIRVSPKDG